MGNVFVLSGVCFVHVLCRYLNHTLACAVFKMDIGQYAYVPTCLLVEMYYNSKLSIFEHLTLFQFLVFFRSYIVEPKKLSVDTGDVENFK